MRLNQADQALEEITESTVEKDHAIEEALRVYAGLDKDYWIERKIQTTTLHPLLTPVQINQAFQEILQKKVVNDNLGNYITQLIQKSYRSGHNEFVLNTQDIAISCLGEFLKGKPENKLRLTIRGNTGPACGLYSRNTQFNILGSTGYECGRFARNSIFNIQGNTGFSCGIESEHSIFNIQGNTDSYCGWQAKNSQFHIQGDAENFCGSYATSCEFNIQGNATEDCGVEAKNTTITISGECGKRLGYLSTRCTFKRPNGEVIKQT